jgi:hypothetical protein
LITELSLEYAKSGKIKSVQVEFDKLKIIGEDLDKLSEKYKNCINELTGFY